MEFCALLIGLTLFDFSIICKDRYVDASKKNLPCSNIIINCLIPCQPYIKGN